MNKTTTKNAKEKCLKVKKQKKQKKNTLAGMSDKQFINAMNIQ